MTEERLFSETEEPPSTSCNRLSAGFPAHASNVVPIRLPATVAKRRVAERFVIGERTDAFRRRFYPAVGKAEWNDWRWQNRHRIRSAEELARVLEATDDELEAIRRHTGPLPLAIAPYYASLLDPADPEQGLRRTVVPVIGEFYRAPGEDEDPLGEDQDSPVPNLVHRYPDRVLFLVTGLCSTYCRYCTRSRMVGATGERSVRKSDHEAALAYIERTPSVRDVLISGGDPLSLDDDRLDYILGRLKRIPHVEFVRLGTKMPAVLPQRITRGFIRMLKRHKPVWMSIHFTHPDEITPEVAEACNRLADAGVPLGSQTVLLKGVNDDVGTMKRLVQGLLKIRVRPYYLYQCDPITGSSHFRTTVDKGIEIIEGLRGHTTGYAVPTFVVDGPGGGGKIPLIPNYLVGRDGEDLVLRNYAGRVFSYHDPGGTLGADRQGC